MPLLSFPLSTRGISKTHKIFALHRILKVQVQNRNKFVISVVREQQHHVFIKKNKNSCESLWQ